MSESNALQKLVWETLTGDAAVIAIVGNRVFDRPPTGAQAPYVCFGPSDMTDDEADCIPGYVEALQIDCWSEAQDGKRECKALVSAVKKCLHKLTGNLDVGALASARVSLTRVVDDPDGISTHGIVTLEVSIEEA